jgi:hypothetical protein
VTATDPQGITRNIAAMFRTRQPQSKTTLQPKTFKIPLRNLSLVLVLLVLLAACNQLTAEGEPELDITDLTPGKLIFTNAQEQELILQNDDAVPVEISAAHITGTDAASFTLANASQFPMTLVPNQQIALRVKFSPQPKQTAFYAALRITSDQAERNAVEVNIYGEAGRDTEENSTTDEEGWTPLFNGRNLDGWYTWLPSTGKNNDPKRVFKAENGMLHILDVPVTGQKQEFGYIARPETFKNYRLRFEYRWGSKRFKPRHASKRDSGLLYHVVGKDKVWPRSVEFQVQEGDTGDFWLLDGATATTTVTTTTTDTPKYQEGGEPFTSQPGSFVRLAKSGTYDYKSGWNQVEVIVTENEAVHIVNGQVNNQARDFMQPDPDNPDKMIPLNAGRIAFQAEGAEVFYRDIKIKPLD